jgi:hypothetical protein
LAPLLLFEFFHEPVHFSSTMRMMLNVTLTLSISTFLIALMCAVCRLYTQYQRVKTIINNKLLKQ